MLWSEPLSPSQYKPGKECEWRERSEKVMMKSLLVSAVALGALTSAATAEEPNQLTSYSAASHSGSSLALLAGCSCDR